MTTSTELLKTLKKHWHTIALTLCWTASAFCAWAAPPAIISFSPSSGAIGATVTITGVGFDLTPANNIVFFGATKATVVSALPTQLTVTVPIGASYAPISVNVAGLTAWSADSFLVTYAGGASLTNCSFAPKVDFAAGTQPHWSALGDIDGDGKVDIAVANYLDNTISVYRNIASPGSLKSSSFAAKVDFATGTTPRDLAIQDIDGDGKPDITVVNFGANTVSIFRNTSVSGTITASSFQPRVDLATANNPTGIAIGDADGDGKPEIILSDNYSNLVSVYQNLSTPGAITSSSFAAPISFGTGVFPNHVALRDFDSDGKRDLVVCDYSSNTISVYKNTSVVGSITSSSFAARITFTAGTNPYYVVIGDFDGDGKPDIIVSNQFSDNISVFRNATVAGVINSTSFENAVNLTTRSLPENLGLADVNGDGKVDLAVSNLNSNMVRVLQNTSTAGSISASITADFPTGSQPYGCLLGDFDGDGKPDITVDPVSSNVMSVYRNTSGEIPAPTISSFTPASGYAATIVTINGTNFNGLAAANSVTFNGIPAKIQSASSNVITVSVPGGDVNGPIVVNSGCGSVASAGNFSIPVVNVNRVYYSLVDSTIWGTSGNGTSDQFITYGTLPRVSSDGRYMIFHRGSSADYSAQNVYTLDLQTNALNLVLDNTDHCVAYSWSHDASKIYFDYVCSILIMNRDGSNQINIQTIDCNDDHPVVRFSDGKIVFINETGVYIMNSDGSGRAHVPNTQGGDYFPYWSHDGQWITFSRYSGVAVLGLPDPTFVNQFKIKEDGSQLTQLSALLPGESLGAAADWTSDNEGIIMAGNIDCREGLFYIPADGSKALKRIETIFPGGMIDRFVGCVIGIPPLSFIPTYNTPTITSFSPTSGNAGTSVEITGTNFSTTAANNMVTFNGVAATVIASTATTITAIVPASATTGPLSVNAGCHSGQSVTSFVICTPPSPPIVSNVTRCGASSILFTATGGSPGQYRWYATSTGGSPIAGQPNGTFLTPELASSTTYYVSLNDGTCESARSAAVAMIEECEDLFAVTGLRLSVPIGGTVSIDLAASNVFAANLDPNSIVVLKGPFSKATVEINSAVLSVNYSATSFAGTDSIKIQACDKNGTCASGVVLVDVIGEVEVFEGVSPNGDGLNDFFMIRYLGVIPGTENNKVSILNRWGDVVWDASSYDNDNVAFKGFSNSGNLLPTGIYFYKIEITGKTKTGFLSLKR